MVNKILKEKFDQNADKYDSQRRLIIPCLDDLYRIIADLAADLAPSNVPAPKILDMGAGTGLLTKYLFKRYNGAEFTLIDLSDKMLDIAKQRFAGEPNFKYIVGDYVEYDFNDNFDIITSSLSIHHLKDEFKELLYDKIHKLLNDGGIFLNADQVQAPSAAGEREYQRNWLEKIEDGALEDGEKRLILERMKLDKPATLEYNLKWLKHSGFKDVDVFYKNYNFVVLYGKKEDD